MEQFIRDHGAAVVAVLFFLLVLTARAIQFLMLRERARDEERFGKLEKDVGKQESEMTHLKESIQQSLAAIQLGQQDLLRANDVAHATITGEIGKLQIRVAGVETKMPNGELERLAKAVRDLVNLTGGGKRQSDTEIVG